MHECSQKYFDIIVMAKSMCFSYAMYDVHSYESKDMKNNLYCVWLCDGKKVVEF